MAALWVSSVSVLGQEMVQNLLLRGIKARLNFGGGQGEGASSPQDLFQGFLPALPVEASFW